MARLLENNSKSLLKAAGVPVPEYDVASSPEEASAIAEKLGKPVVVKALVPADRRGKAGAVRFADSPAEAAQAAGDILGMMVGHYPAEKVLVEEKLDIARELFLSVTIDRPRKLPVIIASSVGGMDVEELTKQHPDQLIKAYVDPLMPLPEFKTREIWCDLGLTGSALREASAVTYRLYQAFVRYDCTILEINPLAFTRDGKLVAAAVVAAVDDNAVYRHPEWASMVQLGSDRTWRPLTELEKKVVAVQEEDPYRGTARYTEMEGGDIGFMCGGGGGSLLVYDTLLSYGGQPANYTEFGGNPQQPKVYGLVKCILSKPGVRGLLVATNITNNTQVDVVARGIVQALRELKVDPASFPVVVRLAGVNDGEGRRIFEEAGVEYHGEDVTMTEAARIMVERLRALGTSKALKLER